MEIGKHYIVTKASDDNTFQVDDHISVNSDGSINNREAQGWIEKCYVDEATKGMEIEIDHQWIERQKKILRAMLYKLDGQQDLK